MLLVFFFLFKSQPAQNRKRLFGKLELSFLSLARLIIDRISTALHITQNSLLVEVGRAWSGSSSVRPPSTKHTQSRPTERKNRQWSGKKIREIKFCEKDRYLSQVYGDFRLVHVHIAQWMNGSSREMFELAWAWARARAARSIETIEWDFYFVPIHSIWNIFFFVFSTPKTHTPWMRFALKAQPHTGTISSLILIASWK